MELTFRSDIQVECIGQFGTDLDIARSAWVSSGNDDKDANLKQVTGLINALIREKHGSPVEAGYLAVRIEAPRSAGIEMMRHRIGWSYSSASLRYREQAPEIYIPPPERPIKKAEGFKQLRPLYEVLTPDEYLQYSNKLKVAHADMYGHYMEMREFRPETEALRFLTSEALYLPYIARCNPRSLMHFLSLRTHRESSNHISWPMWEIEQVANQLETLFEHHWPITHAAWQKFGREAP